MTANLKTLYLIACDTHLNAKERVLAHKYYIKC